MAAAKDVVEITLPVAIVDGVYIIDQSRAGGRSDSDPDREAIRTLFQKEQEGHRIGNAQMVLLGRLLHYRRSKAQ